ncbi:MAG TPA: transporter substrate-binding domain-containing protein [Thermodesulfobacteriota bacterium]|nr:transporter substrate-binding domain-containing protein [Thermodesulfobacteriota bacterium]
MKRNTSLFLLSVLCFLALVYAAEGSAGTLQDVKRRGKLIAGVKTEYPPLAFLDSQGVHKGFNIDIVKSLAKELFGNEEAVEFVPVTPENQIVLLTSGRVDMIAAMGVTEERKKEIDFSIPYFISGQSILVRGDSKITKYQDLAGKQVATLRGSKGDRAIGELVPTAQRINFEHPNEAVNAVLKRRVEAFVEDYVSLYNLVQKNRGLRIAGLEPFSPAPDGVAVREGDKEWLDFINATIEKMKKTGEYEKLLEKWFGVEARVLWRLFKK